MLSRFRVEFHRCLTARGDELFELADAVLCADGPASGTTHRAERACTKIIQARGPHRHSRHPASPAAGARRYRPRPEPGTGPPGRRPARPGRPAQDLVTPPASAVTGAILWVSCGPHGC